MSGYWNKWDSEAGIASDNRILQRLETMVTHGFDPITRQQLSPAQKYEAARVYTGLKAKLAQISGQVTAARLQADAQHAHASANHAHAQAQMAAAQAQMAQASAARAEVESKERIALAQIASDERKSQDAFYLEEQRLLIQKAEVWVKALTAVAAAPPQLAERLMDHVMTVGQQIAGPDTAPIGRQLTSKEEKD